MLSFFPEIWELRMKQSTHLQRVISFEIAELGQHGLREVRTVREANAWFQEEAGSDKVTVWHMEPLPRRS